MTSIMIFLLLTPALLIAAFPFLWPRLKGSSNRSPLPPGPPRRFLVGNLFDIPRFRAWHTFLRWKDDYGLFILAVQLRNTNPMAMCRGCGVC
jgi:hypothetical protein